MLQQSSGMLCSRNIHNIHCSNACDLGREILFIALERTACCTHFLASSVNWKHLLM
jgi:hypothetical protein